MKLRKIITMGLAAIMAVSAMSISVFATETENFVTKDVTFYQQNEQGDIEEMGTFKINVSEDMTDSEIETMAINEASERAGFTIKSTPVNRREGTIPDANSSNWAIGKYFYPASGSNAVALCLEDIQSQVESVNVRLRNESLNSDSYTTEINIQNNGLTVILVNNSFMEHGNQVKISSNYRYAFYVSTYSSPGTAKATVYTGVYN